MRRPLPLSRSLPALGGLFVGAALGLEALACGVLGEAPSAGLHVALGFVAQDFAVGALVALAARRARRASSASGPLAPQAVSVLVAAWNEEDGIAATIRSLRAQRGVDLEIVVADDGSADATAARAQRAFDEPMEGPSPRCVLVRGEHRGKGHALEAARAVARHPILVTVDADTALSPGALARIAAPFDDPSVDAAAGAVVVRGARSWLTRFQFHEYAKNTLARVGWSELGALDQVPGAFAAIRAGSLERAGGFPLDSLTEDYEVAFRLHDLARREGRAIRIETVPEARAYTDPPSTLAGFVRQRTRWFAGFLSTLARFRRLIGARGAGAFGGLRLPLKVIDATLPPIGLASLALLVMGIAAGTAAVGATSLALLGVRAAWDLAMHAQALALHDAAAAPEEAALAAPPARGWRLPIALAESWTYAWWKQFAVLRAYPWALRRVRTWEPSRETGVASARDAVRDDAAPCAPDGHATAAMPR